ncbi:MAG TPA: hypothetical protein VHI78_05260 [Bacteroidales bacterium]|jgi:hypothetical protein|nr:hypothetical protein [Bacteroidales bacterium]
MKKNILYALFYFCLIPLSAQNNYEQMKALEKDFLSADWHAVVKAKENIESLGSSGIPDLITMMNDCRTIKLQNTGDLIYPGAERFFGHGQIIDYDIDVACIRAGWLLEEITFINFGFSGIHLPADELTGFINRNFPRFCSNVENQEKIKGLDEAGKRTLIRDLSIDNARKWWQNSSKQWTRLNALELALNSDDEKSQVKALFYLRNGVTSCKGLSQKFYKSKLSKVVERLSKSETGRVSENAKLIMLDSDFSWLDLKPDN